MSDSHSQPLQGKRILVTRTREQASQLSERLQALGAVAVEFPTIRIVPPQDWRTLDAALHRLFSAHEQSGYDWLVLTSVNGVHICCQRMQALGYDPALLQSPSEARHRTFIATIGPATAAALPTYGLTADLVPDEYIAEGVASALRAHAQLAGKPLAEQRFLLARATEARKVLADDLRAAGAFVDDVPAYVTLSVASNDTHGREILRQLQEGLLDILTFTSSSTVRNFVAWLKSCEQATNTPLLEQLNRQIAVACIGPVTSQTARELGLDVTIEGREFTIDGLVHAIVETTDSLHHAG